MEKDCYICKTILSPGDNIIREVCGRRRKTFCSWDCVASYVKSHFKVSEVVSDQALDRIVRTSDRYLEGEFYTLIKSEAR